MRQMGVKIAKPAFPGVSASVRARALLGSRPAGGRWRRASKALAPVGFIALAALVDAVAILGAALVSPTLYRALTLGLAPSVESVASIGTIAALLVALSTIQRGGYDRKHYLVSSGQFSRALSAWGFAILGALALSFATKTSSEFSRGAVGVFCVSGLVALTLGRRALVDAHAMLRRTSLAAPRRLIAIGFEDCLESLMGDLDWRREGVDVVSMIALRDNQACFADDLALAAAAVRMRRPDDIVLAIPWSRASVIEACIDAFLQTPAEIHLRTDGLLERFGEAKITRLGPIVGLNVTHAPLTRLELLEKRVFDIVVASLALIALSPLFALVALLIRLDSPGAALFRQNRYGFNQEAFRIYKFRTMTTVEDGDSVVQATRSDPRVTRLGAFLRRFSIDELPQLLNVLLGDMSIVGPRPHALVHDQQYVQRLARYARRHNVRPGITGWAQVNGHRGEISSDAKMRARLEHDLYYIDNWSFLLDVKIMLLTVFSRKAHSNAY